jgi:ABC-type glutathione transport system ATPase component
MPTASGRGSAVSAQDLSIRFRTRDARSHVLAVDGVTIDVAAGQTLALMGDSGAGKSTLAAAVALTARRGHPNTGYPEICGGALAVLGARVRRMGPHQRQVLARRIGYLPQDGADRLKPYLTVGENVAEPIFDRNRRFSQHEAAGLVATMVDAVHLPLASITSMPHELSRGNRQRVALARALILQPDLLVADGPTNGMDLLVRVAVMDTLHRLHEEWGFSALIVSNDPNITRVATRVAVMRRGIIIGIGSVDELRAGPCAPYLPEVA